MPGKDRPNLWYFICTYTYEQLNNVHIVSMRGVYTFPLHIRILRHIHTTPHSFTLLRFFLEIDHNVKYTKLEWYVIILITVEIMISIPGHILNHYS